MVLVFTGGKKAWKKVLIYSFKNFFLWICVFLNSFELGIFRVFSPSLGFLWSSYFSLFHRHGKCWKKREWVRWKGEVIRSVKWKPIVYDKTFLLELLKGSNLHSTLAGLRWTFWWTQQFCFHKAMNVRTLCCISLGIWKIVNFFKVQVQDYSKLFKVQVCIISAILRKLDLWNSVEY